MPIKDPEKRKEYARLWVKKRRDEFFSDKQCLKCESKEDLVLHHRDPSKKEHHCIWSWSKIRRDIEIAKCDVLCNNCHVELHSDLLKKEITHGNYNDYKTRGCRCSKCKEAVRLYQQEYRNRN